MQSEIACRCEVVWRLLRTGKTVADTVRKETKPVPSPVLLPNAVLSLIARLW